MKVLVTGATGFLGKHLCQRLVSDGYKVTVLSRASSDTEYLDTLNLKKITGDVCDPEAVNRAVAGNDAVIHAAADISYWERHKDRQNKTNIQGTKNIVESCLEHGIQRLIHVSSVVAVGVLSEPELPADESFCLDLKEKYPNYHNSKRNAEGIVLTGVKKGLNGVIVNPAFIWGLDGKKYRGAEFVQKILQNSVAPYFTGGICIVHIEDVIEGIMLAFKSGKPGERYILGGENISFRSINKAVARKKNIKRIFIPLPRAVTWLASLVMESTANITGLRPRITYASHYGASRFYYYKSNKAQEYLGYSFRNFDSILDECFSYLESRRN